MHINPLTVEARLQQKLPQGLGPLIRCRDNQNLRFRVPNTVQPWPILRGPEHHHDTAINSRLGQDTRPRLPGRSTQYSRKAKVEMRITLEHRTPRPVGFKVVGV